jgi:hypothetical protein
VIAALAVAAIGGSGGFEKDESTARAASSVPPPPLARVVPENYRVQKVWRVRLTGGSVPEVVVSSVGPSTGSLPLHPADLQVLSWDGLARRWIVVFDGQRVGKTETGSCLRASNLTLAGCRFVETRPGSRKPAPLLDPAANVTIGEVRFARLLPGRSRQLIFHAVLDWGGSGAPGVFVIVDFSHGLADVFYEWEGEGLIDYRIVGRRVVARALFWTDVECHACQHRVYRFVIGKRPGSRTLDVLSDQRPWLGVHVRALGPSARAPLLVVEVAQDSPADSVFKRGDVLLSLQNAPHISDDLLDLPGAQLIEQIEYMNAGQTARFVIRRGGIKRTVAVKLGSLADFEADSMLLPSRRLMPNAYLL